MCGLNNWWDELPLTQIQGGEVSFWGSGEDPEFSLGRVEFGLLIVHPRQSC